jgi:hypothetical protein
MSLWGNDSEDPMTDKSNSEARPMIGFITRDNAPQIGPAPISRTWMSEMAELRIGWLAQSVSADAHR